MLTPLIILKTLIESEAAYREKFEAFRNDPDPEKDYDKWGEFSRRIHRQNLKRVLSLIIFNNIDEHQAMHLVKLIEEDPWKDKDLLEIAELIKEIVREEIVCVSCGEIPDDIHDLVDDICPECQEQETR